MKFICAPEECTYRQATCLYIHGGLWKIWGAIKFGSWKDDSFTGKSIFSCNCKRCEFLELLPKFFVPKMTHFLDVCYSSPFLCIHYKFGFGYRRASLVAQLVKNPPVMWETWVQSLGWEGLLEKGMAPPPVFWPGEFHGLYSPWGHKELDRTFTWPKP